MANLTNCPICGRRENPHDVHLIGGRYICADCADRIPDWLDFDGVYAWVQGQPVAEPLDISGRNPLPQSLRA
jgi:hypothetical protein